MAKAALGQTAGLTFLARHRAALAAGLCALLFLLGTSDRLFALRIAGVNVRYANLLLALGLMVWLVRNGRGVVRDLAALAVAWLPFVAVYALASMRSGDPSLGLLKLAWFAFGFAGAFAWSRLFERAHLARGLFCAYLAIAAIIVVDFATGFVHGERAMIGYGQPNDLVDGVILWRPHAFYYEPSYAASGVGLAWALAMTPVARDAPRVAAALVVVGAFALIVVMSRTGWVFALIVLVALALVRLRDDWRQLRGRWAVIALGCAGSLLVVSAGLAHEANRTRFATLVDTLGFARTFDRVCPLLRDDLGWRRLGCERSDEALRAARVDVSKETSEGQRIVNLRETLASIGERPWLGHGVTRGERRLIEPVASNVWLEIALEGGVVAALAFAWGLAASMRRYGAFARGQRTIAFVLLLYFGFVWQFIQTFPRLDQWLVFWAALAIASAHAGAARGTASGPSAMLVEPGRQPLHR